MFCGNLPTFHQQAPGHLSESRTEEGGLEKVATGFPRPGTRGRGAFSFFFTCLHLFFLLFKVQNLFCSSTVP